MKRSIFYFSLFQSLKFCLLFCANGGDLILKDISQDASFRPNLVQFKIGNIFIEHIEPYHDQITLVDFYIMK